MAKLDENGLLYLWQRFKSIFATKAELKDITDNMGNMGYGDMMKATYDTNNNGKVDDADKLGGQLPEYYAKKSELFSGSYEDLTDKPTNFAPSDHTHEIKEINGLEETAAEMVALISTKADTSALNSAVEDMAEIARGKCASYVFNTVDELDTWLANSTNTENLRTGDVFYIRAVDVPDYWWDKETGTKQILETTKVDLTAITNEEIDAILAT